MEYFKCFHLQLMMITIKYGIQALSFPRPSVVSNWLPIKSQSGEESQVTFTHGLNELPYKVVVEVKVVSDGSEYMFHAIGSASADDDLSYDYGGIVYVYDEKTVIAMAPNVANGKPFGYSIYTGGSGWTGPCCVDNTYTEAMLRIKVWGSSDFDVPDFIHNWTPISTTDAETFKEIAHNLGDYPDLIVVQVQGENNITSEAQGSTGKMMITKKFLSTGGVLFGYSNQSVRIWYPNQDFIGDPTVLRRKAFLIMINDGWGTDSLSSIWRGSFRILAWKRVDNWCLESRISASNEIRVIADFDDSYVTVEVEAVDGANDGFRFHGIGSAMSDGATGGYGGLVYAYSDQKVLYWVPNSSNLTGHVIQIGEMWGAGVNNQSSDDVKIRVRVYNVPSNVKICRTKDVYVEEFRVDKKSTSAYRRSKVSVYDNRTSAVTVGSVGVAVLVTLIAITICSDLPNLLLNFKEAYRNLKNCKEIKICDIIKIKL